MTAGEYRETAPSASLARHVECFWRFRRVAAVGLDGHQRVLPDGCIDILFDLTSASGPTARVVGAMTRPLLVPLDGRANVLGIRFAPGGARPVLGIPACASTDLTVDLAEFGKFADGVIHALGTAGSEFERISLCETILLKRLALAQDPEVDLRIAAAVRTFAVSDRASVRTVSTALGVSRQHLRRLFEGHVGVGPKLFARIARAQRVVAEFRSRTPQDLADCAVRHGFSDQAHMTNEMRELTGLTPATWCESARPA